MAMPAKAEAMRQAASDDTGSEAPPIGRYSDIH